MGIANIISIFGMAILETQLINDRVTEVLTARRARSPGPESSSGVPAFPGRSGIIGFSKNSEWKCIFNFGVALCLWGVFFLEQGQSVEGHL